MLLHTFLPDWGTFTTVPHEANHALPLFEPYFQKQDNGINKYRVYLQHIIIFFDEQTCHKHTLIIKTSKKFIPLTLSLSKHYVTDLWVVFTRGASCLKTAPPSCVLTSSFIDFHLFEQDLHPLEFRCATIQFTPNDAEMKK